MFFIEKICITASILIGLSILTSKLAIRLGLPMVLFFLGIGVLAGKYQLNLVDWYDRDSVKMFGIFTLTIIIFNGGLSTPFSHLAPILREGILLSSLGIIISTLLSGLFLYMIGELSFLEGCLLGTIISSTDAAAVFSLLRGRQIFLKNNLSRVLEFESIVNDVVVCFTMTLSLKILQHYSISWIYGIILFCKEMFIGGIGGLIAGRIMVFLLNYICLSFSSLYAIFTLAMMMMVYGLVNRLHGSGFLAVYCAGIVIASYDCVHKRSILEFFKGVGWLLQILMFISLGLLVEYSKWISFSYSSLFLSFFVICVARPVAVFIALYFSSTLSWREKVLVTWGGLRGAGAVLFSIYPYVLQECVADKMFYIIFSAVVASIFFQGSTFHQVTRWLNLEDRARVAEQEKKIHYISGEIKKKLIELEIPIGSTTNGKSIMELMLPKTSLIALIQRKNRYFVPKGKTEINEGDKLLVMVDSKQELKQVQNSLGM